MQEGTRSLESTPDLAMAVPIRCAAFCARTCCSLVEDQTALLGFLVEDQTALLVSDLDSECEEDKALLGLWAFELLQPSWLALAKVHSAFANGTTAETQHRAQPF